MNSGHDPEFVSLHRRKNMNLEQKFEKVNDSLTVNRYDNGWMVEISGKDEKDDWVTVKLLCTTQDEIFKLLESYNKLEVSR